MPRAAIRAGALAASFGALLLAFFFVARPWYSSWGADDELQKRTASGRQPPLARGVARDTGHPDPGARRAVWPWVAQIGQDRGGFYSYAILENLVGCHMRNLDFLIPALQHWEEGDKLWMYPPNAGGGIGQAPLALYYAGRALVFYTRRPGTAAHGRPDGTWAFVVATNRRDDLTPGHARAGARKPGPPRRELRTERVRAGPLRHGAQDDGGDQGARGRPTRFDDARRHPGSALGADLRAVRRLRGFVLEGRAWRWHTVTFTAAGLLFGILTLVQPSVWLGAPLVLVLGAATARHVRRPQGAPRR